jgi:putative two-component system response regulator
MVVTASDGAEAINLLSSNDNISAMVLDLFMPNVDGFKVLEFMKENELFTAIPVSIITGNDDKEVDMSVFEYPIIDILKKPFNEVAVKTIVDRTVNSKNKVSY